VTSPPYNTHTPSLWRLPPVRPARARRCTAASAPSCRPSRAPG